MSGIDSLRISEPKKKYITEVLNPLLEEMVTECLASMPEDPVNFMVDWLRRNKIAGGGGDDAAIVAENESLKAEIAQHAAIIDSKSSVIAQVTADKDEEEEEEEEDDDDCDELPESFQKPQSQFGKARASVSAEVYGAWNQKKEFTPPVYPKSDEQGQRIRTVLAGSFMFAALEEKDLEVVISAMKEVQLKEKDRPINQGEDGDYLFVIESGTLDCWKKFAEGEEEKLVKSVEAGDCFGELALLYNCPRAASVESRGDCILWQLDRETFNHIVKDSAAKKREKYNEFLSKVPLLETTDAYEKSQIADALKPECMQKDELIITAGEVGDRFFILEEGECAAFKDDEKVMDYKAGDYFGELALLKDEPRAATVKVMSDSAKVLILDRRSFKRLLGPLQELLSKASSKYR